MGGLRYYFLCNAMLAGNFLANLVVGGKRCKHLATS